MCKVLETLADTEFPLVITGDFNLPAISWHENPTSKAGCSKEDVFLEFVMMNSLHQLVIGPTRPVSGTTLGLILTNCAEIISEVIIFPSPSKSDHHALWFSLNVWHSTDSGHVESLDYRRTDFDYIEATLFATD